MTLADFIISIIVISVFLIHVMYVQYFERKTIGHMQARLGPMRVGWHGILQPIADSLKLFFKEDIIPSQSDKPIFFIAPIIGVIAGVSSLAVIPLWETFSIADLNIGILYILALSSVGAYSVIIGGWASNSKYSFLGGLRASAQVISYEISMGLSLVGVMMMAGSANLADIVKAQSEQWFIIPQFLAFGIFFISALAETNRVPFDLPEAEAELVSGFATEYSGMRWALFFMAEYAGVFIMSALAAVCFLGGWSGPDIWFFSYVPDVVWLILKVYAFVFLYFWIRSTLPRYRYDQLMNIGWKILIPLSLANIILTGLLKIV
ncbi:MAG: NADH-quinone oxidoreductase subunit NuoH [Thermodesulfovibrionia bacterium]|nr:NADH-quinone oxidoreductase subunit NuoH [Thermodesulfovibrionia bacterium]